MMKSVIKRVIVAILLCVLVFSVAKIITYFEQKAEAEHMQRDIIHEHVTPESSETTDPVVSEDEEQPANADTTDEDEEPAQEQSTAPTVSQAPVTTGGSAVAPADGSDGVSVDFSSLRARYPDVVGYIYSPGTRIQYPIAYMSSNNDFYLNRDLDGNLNVNGSIFIEHLNSPNFSHQNTIIYGHHMKSGLMFADLCKYKDASYYSSHPYMYIYTPEQDYRIDLFAACVVESVSDIYSFEPSSEVLWSCINSSTFDADIDYPENRIVTLSTCTYEYDDARYVVLGELVPIEVEWE